MIPSTSHPASIFVFETDIRFKKDVLKITSFIESDYRIKKWNVDRNDRSNVLRIEASDLRSSEIIELVTSAGYRCEELPD